MLKFLKIEKIIEYLKQENQRNLKKYIKIIKNREISRTRKSTIFKKYN